MSTVDPAYKVKRLRSYTIIPEHLYVSRAADKQLRNVLSDMGRPGYVLVARQMGKTNLLLNAKRELESSDDFFIYVDLSNAFPNVEQFFRNIVDVAIDSNPERFSEAATAIYTLRAQQRGLPPHKEHEQELRLLLRSLRGKIVICLDEIDALTNLSYSDNVFSQIRSTYFSSRVNFDEFHRLTYVLSGVAEPNEIIKNKNISPFNIGEKIYLDDFSLEEFFEFAHKASLELEEICLMRVFHWASGNPRISWDICSALEDIYIEGHPITAETVDKVVQRLYLTDFDLAPVDHIRKIVEEDRDLRNAVASIQYEKYSSISDIQRSKLYLAGIIKSDYSAALRIKNRVIEESLNLEWIAHLENSEISLLERANKKFKERDFLGALELFEACEAGEVAPAEVQLLYHKIASCCINLRRYPEAIEYLNKRPFKKSEFPSLYYVQMQWLGTAHYRLGRIDESISSFEKVVEADFGGDELPISYYEAAVNLAVAYSLKFDEYGHKIPEITRRLIENQEKVFALADSRNSATKLVCAAYHNLALAKRRVGAFSEAGEAWKNALALMPIESKPKVIAELFTVSEKVERVRYLRAAAEIIRDHGLVPETSSTGDPFGFTLDVFANLLNFAFLIEDEKSKRALLSHLNSLDSENMVPWTIIRSAGYIALAAQHLALATKIFKAALAIPQKFSILGERKSILSFVLTSDKSGNLADFEKEYLGLFEQNENSIDELDIRMMYQILDRSLASKKFTSTRRLLELFTAKTGTSRKVLITDENDQQKPVSVLMIDYAELKLLIAERKVPEAHQKAELIRRELSDDLLASWIYNEHMLSVMKQDVEFVLSEYADRSPLRNFNKKYGRNDIVAVRYKDGTEKRGKYKHYEGDILRSECRLIER